MPAPYQYYQNPQGNFFRTRTKITNLPKGTKYFGEHRKGKAAWNAAKAELSNQQALEQKPGEGGWLQQKLQGLKNFAAGEPSKELTFQQLSPEQQNLLNQKLLPYIQKLLGQEQTMTPEQYAQGFAPFEAQARKQFAQETIPSISERFNVLSGGQGRSGAFAQILGQAGQDLETNLAAQRAQFGQQQQQANRQQLLGSLGYGLGHNIENAYIPRQPGFFENVLAAGAGGAGKALGAKFMGGL